MKRVQVKFASNGEVDLRRVHSNSKGYVVKKPKYNSYDWLYMLTGDDKEYLLKECPVGRRSIKPKEEQRLEKMFINK